MTKPTTEELIKSLDTLGTSSVVTSPGGPALRHDASGTAIALIRKCGSSSFEEAAREVGGFTRIELDLETKCAWGAIIRDPVTRWASGFATQMAAASRRGRIPVSHVRCFLQDEKAIARILEQVVFDVHTKPQALVLKPVLESVRCFSFENREPLYAWMASRGCHLPQYDLHRTLKYDPVDIHVVLYKLAMKLVKRRDVATRLREFYAQDVELYARAVDG